MCTVSNTMSDLSLSVLSKLLSISKIKSFDERVVPQVWLCFGSNARDPKFRLNHTFVPTWHTAPDVDCLEFFPVVGHHILISCKLSCLTRFFSGFKCPLSQEISKYSGSHFNKHLFSVHIQIIYTKTLYCTSSCPKTVCKKQMQDKNSQCYKNADWKLQPSVLVSYLNPCFFKMLNDSTVKHGVGLGLLLCSYWTQACFYRLISSFHWGNSWWGKKITKLTH